jgi:hypothetical protein
MTKSALRNICLQLFLYPTARQFNEKAPLKQYFLNISYMQAVSFPCLFCKSQTYDDSAIAIQLLAREAEESCLHENTSNANMDCFGRHDL